MPFDLLIRGGLLVDGTGSAARPADVGVLGDRILAVGDLSAVEAGDVELVIDAAGLVVAPGFIDPHGHSDGSLFVDGALASHLRQGFTTQVSGNCGFSLAPLTPIGRAAIDVELATLRLTPRWRTFAEYLDRVDATKLGPNVAILAGHGTIRASVLGSEARAPADVELAAMVRELERALDAGAIGLSSGLIYAPGLYAEPAEVETLVRVVARRGLVYSTHMRNEAAGLFASLDESIAAIRAGGDGARLQVSHLKAGARSVWGRGGEAVEVLDRARTEGLDVGADQYPYTAAATGLQVVLPPALLALDPEETVAALQDPAIRFRAQAEMERGISGWENSVRDPGWEAIRISWSGARPETAGRTIAALAAEADREPAEIAFDLLVDDRLGTAVVIECMDEADVETILAVPWIAVCTDAEGRRAGHPILDEGVPHPRTYGSTARVLGRYVRERRTLSLETAIAKMTSLPARQIGLRDRGIVREGAIADLVVIDPATVIDTATDQTPAQYPLGIEHVIVGGAAAVVGGAETGRLAGRLIRSPR
ncbi:MAG TPA: D-aminoacylase [Candidatus Limnocylindrales bacterium]|nr:D-aminoacylase [Candidatus Limnocylindrales bacterium]